MARPPFSPSPAMELVRETAAFYLDASHERPSVEATSPLAWCAKAGVPYAEWVAWNAEYGEVFRGWFFGEIAADSQASRAARSVLFWRAMDRALNATAPNASVLKLYAEIVGLVGKNAVALGLDQDEAGEDEEAWALIEGLPVDVLATLTANAEAREAERLRVSVATGQGDRGPEGEAEGQDPDVVDEWDEGEGEP